MSKMMKLVRSFTLTLAALIGASAWAEATSPAALGWEASGTALMGTDWSSLGWQVSSLDELKTYSFWGTIGGANVNSGYYKGSLGYNVTDGAVDGETPTMVVDMRATDDNYIKSVLVQMKIVDGVVHAKAAKVSWKSGGSIETAYVNPTTLAAENSGSVANPVTGNGGSGYGLAAIRAIKNGTLPKMVGALGRDTSTWGGDQKQNNIANASPGPYRLVPAGNTPYTTYGEAFQNGSFTVSTYLNIEAASPADNKRAVIWSYGSAHDNSVGKLILTVVPGGKIKLYNFTGNTLDEAKTLTTGKLTGWHLVTVTFDATSGSTLTVDAGDRQVNAAMNHTPSRHYQIGSIHGDIALSNNAFVNGEVGNIFIADLLTYAGVVEKGVVDAVSSTYATDNRFNYQINESGKTIYLTSMTADNNGAGENYVGLQGGTWTVPAGVSANLTNFRMLNSSDSNKSVTLNLDGTITMSLEQTNNNIWGNGKGVLFGHYRGTGTYNISGTLDASKTYLQLRYSAGTQTLNVNGGTIKAKDVHFANANGYTGTVDINMNGGLIETTTATGVSANSLTVNEGENTLKFGETSTFSTPLTLTDGTLNLDVAENKTLTVSGTVTENGGSIVKVSEGTVVLPALTGSVTLKAGKIKSSTTLSVVPGIDGMMVVGNGSDATPYALAQVVAKIGTTPYASIDDAKAACKRSETIVIVRDTNNLANFAKASDYTNVGAIEIAPSTKATGHLPDNASTCALTINGTLDLSNGYTGKPTTIPMLKGTGAITKSWSGTPTIYVQEHDEWSGTADACVQFSIAKSDSDYYYTIDAVKAAVNADKTVTNISITEAQLAGSDYKIVNGAIVAKTYVAQVGTAKYETLAAALNAVTEGQTIQLLPGTIEEGEITLPTTIKNVTIAGASDHASILKNTTLAHRTGDKSFDGLTIDGVVFDNGRFILVDWGAGSIKNLTFTNNIFRNLNDATNEAAIHLNLNAASAVSGFRFENNVIDGCTGASKSGIYGAVTGNTTIRNNTFNNVAFRPILVQIIDTDGVADNTVVTGNTFSGSSVGRLQIYGTENDTTCVPEGTDGGSFIVNNNIFKDITGSQQICCWGINTENVTTDITGNYYDVENPRMFWNDFNGANSFYLSDTAIAALLPHANNENFSYYTELEEDGTIKESSKREIIAKTYVAQIGETKYETLSAAVAASKRGDTIKLLADFENIGAVTLPAGVTIDGLDGETKHTISGASGIFIPQEGGCAIKNICFVDIHNNSAWSDASLEKYGEDLGVSAGYVGTQSAIYATPLEGDLEIRGCSFDNIDWDAIQITCLEFSNAATIRIIDNEFRHTNATTAQLRYIHIESTTVFDGRPNLMITDNRFYNTAYTHPVLNVGIWNAEVKDGANTVALNGNWFENINNVAISFPYGSSYLYPARSQADVDVDDLSVAAEISKTGSTDKLQFATIEGAIAAANQMGEEWLDADEIRVTILQDCTVTSPLTLNNVNGLTIRITSANYRLTAEGCDLFHVQTPAFLYGSLYCTDATKYVADVVDGVRAQITCPKDKLTQGQFRGNGIVVVGSEGGLFDHDVNDLIGWTALNRFLAIEQSTGEWKLTAGKDADWKAKGFKIKVSSAWIGGQTPTRYFNTLTEIVENTESNGAITLIDNVTLAQGEGQVRGGATNGKQITLGAYTLRGPVESVKELTIKNGSSTPNQTFDFIKTTGAGLTLGSSSKYNTEAVIKDADIGTLLMIYRSFKKVTIEGGRYKSDGSKFAVLYTYSSEKSELVVKGGIFGCDQVYDSTPKTNIPLSDFVPEGYAVVANSDVETKDAYPYAVVPVVAKIVRGVDAVYFETFAEAIAAATGGEAIVVLNYNAETMEAPEGYKFVTNEGVTTLVQKVYVAQIGETKYETINAAFADVNNQTGEDVTIKILCDIKEKLGDDYELFKNVNLVTDVEGGVTVDFDHVSTDDDSSIETVGKTLTIAEGVNIVRIYQLFNGYYANRTDTTDIYGDAELCQLWAANDSIVNIYPTAHVVMGCCEGMVKLRWSGTLNVTGSANDSQNKQLSGGYIWTDYPGVKTVNLKDTYVSTAWLTVDDKPGNQGGGSLNLSLDNATLETAHESATGVSYGAAGGTISMKNGSLIIAGAIKNVTTITIDGASYGAEAVKVIDYTGSGTMTLADYATTVTVTGGEMKAEVRDNDLWIAPKVYVAQIGAGETAQKYESLQAAVDAAVNGTVITLLERFSTDEAITVRGKAVEIRTADYNTAATPTVGLRVNYMDKAKITAQTIIYFRKPVTNTSTPTEIDRLIVGDFEAGIDVLTAVNEAEAVRYNIGIHDDITLTKDIVIPDDYGHYLTAGMNVKVSCTFDLNGHSLTQTPGAKGGWSNIMLFDATCDWTIPDLESLTFTLKDSKKTGAIYVPLHAVNATGKTVVNIEDVKIVYGHNCTQGDVTQDNKSGGQAIVAITTNDGGTVNLTGSTSLVRDEECILTGAYPWVLLPYAGSTINVESGYYEGLFSDAYGNLNITGGTFTSYYILWFTADGYAPANDGHDVWTVVPDEEIVASIGLDCFTDLQTAVDYAEEGDVIDIEKDNTTAVTIPVGVTIRLNGYTTGTLSAPMGFVVVDGAESGTKTVAREEILIDMDGSTTAPIKVSEEWIAAKFPEGATTAQIKTKLETVEANGFKGWQNYVMGVDGSVAANALKPIEGVATPDEKDGKTEPIVITAPLAIANAPAAADAKIAVSYQLFKGTMDEDGEIAWVAEGEPAAAPRFVIDFKDTTGDTYWKIAVVFTSVK